MEELLKYHIKETERRFDEIREDLQDIQQKMSAVCEFKTEAVVTSKIASLIISAVCGFLTFVISTFVAIRFK